MLLIFLPSATAQAIPSGVTRLASATPGGASGNNGTGDTTGISGDGRFVVFTSTDTDLVDPAPVYTGGMYNVFVRDVVTGTTRLVSVSPDGTHAANGGTGQAVISADGRYVAFDSGADNLVTGPTYTVGKDNIFVRDLQTGTTQLASVAPGGAAAGNDASSDPSISADGHRVAFTTLATNLTSLTDANGNYDVYLYDVIAPATLLVSVNAGGTATGDDLSEIPRISADGKFVAFESDANDLMTGQGGVDASPGTTDVFIRDIGGSATQLMSVNAAGTAVGNGVSVNPGAISADGRFVVFESSASDLTAAGFDNNGKKDVFRADRLTGAIALASVNNAGTHSGSDPSSKPVLSSDGRFVAFESNATDLAAPGLDTSAGPDIYWRDIAGATNALMSVNSTGTASGNALSQTPQISADGRFVIFESNASNLAPGVTDGNGTSDDFRRDVVGGVTQAMSVTPAGIATGDPGGTGNVVISADGRFVAFSSQQPNLTSVTATGQNVYVRGDFVPSAAFTASPLTGTAPLTVAFDASGSSDVEGLAGFAWSFGDGANGSGATTSHSYAAAGDYTATLTVTDSGGNTATATRGISVGAAPGVTENPITPVLPALNTNVTPRTAGPLVVLSGPVKQRIVRQGSVKVTVRCSDEDCGVTASGTLNVPGVARSFRLTSARKALLRGAKATLELKLSKAALKAAKTALAHRKRVTARVLVGATDSGGRITRVKRTITAQK